MSARPPARAMVLAAGEGRRLRPLTDELPKPALPVANRPAAWFALDHLARVGYRDVVLNAYHLGARLEQTLAGCTPAGQRLSFVHEPRLLGTGGGIRGAWRPEPGVPFVVANGKLVFAPDLEAALRRHADTGAIATMILRTLPAGSTFAPVEVDADGFVRRLRGLPAHAADPGLRTCMFTGVHVLSPRAWDDLPEEGDVIEHTYLRWIEREEPIASVLDDGPWIDVGVTPRHYLEANLAFAAGRVRWPGIVPDSHAVLADRDAEVGSRARLEEVVLGARAVVEPGVTLRRVVVWPGARVTGDLEDAIVTATGRIVEP